ncbi:MAG: hypothetical protein EON54_01335 [Alcaligenaceae bacterium]|nr:MAG: hypothetical protein EON54_01335 [Alcaligenaceae bacterium]
MGFLNDIANNVDNVGTRLGIGEFGVSEFLNGGKNTSNSGRISGNGLNNIVQGVGVVGPANGIAQQYNGGQGGQLNAQKPGATTTSPDLGGASYDPAAAAAARERANNIGILDQSASTIQNGLNRLGGQLDIARSNIGSQFSQKDNELNSQRASTENSYKTSTTQNGQNLRTNKNTITDQASSGLRGLMRMLGSYGAVGSDLGLAGSAVADDASQKNAGAGQTFAQNQQSLDTNWGNYRSQFDNEKKKVNDWRDNELRNAEATSLSTRQDLLSKLADIRGQRAAAAGGNYAGAAAAQLAEANSLSSRIDGLGRLNPTYTGNTPVYTQAELDSYRAGQGTAASAENAGGVAGGLNTPYLNMLLGREEQKKPLGV